MIAGVLSLKRRNEQSEPKEAAGKLFGFPIVPLPGLVISSDPGPRISPWKQLSFRCGVFQ